MSDVPDSRRRFIQHAGLAGFGIAVGASVSALENDKKSQAIYEKNASDGSGNGIIPFYGEHQAGITTTAQKYCYFLVVSLHTTDIVRVREMFRKWTEYSASLSTGKHVQPYSKNHFIPAPDTGEADSLSPSNLTLTFGVSPSFFNKLKINRLRPEGFKDLPHFPRDQLKPEYSDGDICIQSCADDPQVAFHAIRNLVRSARSYINMKWSQSGFNSFEGKDTPRNLFAFKDGTANDRGKSLNDIVWVDGDGWLQGGSYLVARRIKMFLETWDRTSLSEQRNTFGRFRDSGAPMGAKNRHDEFESLNLSRKNKSGELAIPSDSHVHLAHKTGRKILRRSFSYADGIDAQGQFDAGLMFISFQKNPQAFIDLQNAFGNVDKMNEYITHVGSGLFACFPGVRDEKDYLGRALFEKV